MMLQKLHGRVAGWNEVQMGAPRGLRTTPISTSQPVLVKSHVSSLSHKPALRHTVVMAAAAKTSAATTGTPTSQPGNHGNLMPADPTSNQLNPNNVSAGAPFVSQDNSSSKNPAQSPNMARSKKPSLTPSRASLSHPSSPTPKMAASSRGSSASDSRSNSANTAKSSVQPSQAGRPVSGYQRHSERRVATQTAGKSADKLASTAAPNTEQSASTNPSANTTANKLAGRPGAAVLPRRTKAKPQTCIPSKPPVGPVPAGHVITASNPYLGRDGVTVRTVGVVVVKKQNSTVAATGSPSRPPVYPLPADQERIYFTSKYDPMAKVLEAQQPTPPTSKNIKPANPASQIARGKNKNSVPARSIATSLEAPVGVVTGGMRVEKLRPTGQYLRSLDWASNPRKPPGKQVSTKELITQWLKGQPIGEHGTAAVPAEMDTASSGNG